MVTIKSDSQELRDKALQAISTALLEKGISGEFTVEEFTNRNGEVCF